jgi:hypothetical protein
MIDWNNLAMNTGPPFYWDGLLLQPKQKTTKENLDKW